MICCQTLCVTDGCLSLWYLNYLSDCRVSIASAANVDKSVGYEMGMNVRVHACKHFKGSKNVYVDRTADIRQRQIQIRESTGLRHVIYWTLQLIGSARIHSGEETARKRTNIAD